MHMQAAEHMQMKIKRRPSFKPSAENLFGKRFSGLTIDDEYLYNLEYLISQNRPICSTEHSYNRVEATVIDSKRHLNMPTKEHSKGYNETRKNAIENYRTRLKHFESFKSKQPCEHERDMSYCKSKNAIGNHSELVKNGTISTSSICPATDTKEEKGFYGNKNNKSDKAVQIERLNSQRKAINNAHQPSSPVYPGLHIHVTESPHKAYCESVPSIQSTNSQFIKKTEANDHVTSIYSGLRSKNTINMIPQRDENDLVNNKKYQASIRKSFEDIEHASVASRVEAFMALLKPKISNFLPEDNSAIPNACFNHENQITPPTEGSTKRPYVRLQRAATINYGKSGSVILSQNAEYCFTCCKRIYPVDRVSIGDRVYHKGCFRCATCQRIVLPGNFASLNGIILCKPHYIEQFRLSGRYELRPFSDKKTNFDNSSSTISLRE